MKMKLPKKHHGAETTIFAKMTALALQENAANLSQGFPDDEIHPHLKKLLAEATANNYNQYAPMNGLPMFVETLIDFNQKRNISVSKD